jgi:hypothetical protein
MAFAQLTYRDSLRDIEACLRSMQGKLYHMGFRGKVARSTEADANELRDWRIYVDFAQVLIGAASLPQFVPLGPVSPTQSRGEDAYSARPARQLSYVPKRMSYSNGAIRMPWTRVPVHVPITLSS